MIVFLKRLVGIEPGQVQEQERFTRNLNGIAAKNKELDGLKEVLDEIVVAVEEKTSAQRSARPSGMSGEHKIEVPEGAVAGGAGKG